MAKPKRKKLPPWLSTFNEKEFTPFTRTIGQSTLLWNDLHEWLGHIYGVAMGAGVMNIHHNVWSAITNDRAKRDMLLAAARWTFVEGPPFPTALQKKSFDAIKYLYDECKKLEDDRNNAIHAPLFRSRVNGEVYPASAFGNIRAKNLENKYLLREYRRLRDAALLLRNYAALIYDPMCDGQLAWPDKPKLPDRGATRRPPLPPRPAKPAKRVPIP